MGKYAEECGLTVSNDDIQACQDAYADADDTEKDQCAEWSDPDALREWWTCENLAENFQNGAK